MSVTMQDVAQRAGVSVRTVSRVVNHRGEVSEATRQRVLETIKILGYRPSKLARALVTQRTDTIGLLIADITNPYFSEVARGVLDTAKQSGYEVFLCNTDSVIEKEQLALQSLADHAVDGTIIFPVYGNEAYLEDFAEQYGPLVSINHTALHFPGISCILPYFAVGAKLAVDHLVDKGHTAIAMLSGEYDPEVLPRVRGYREALASHGLGVRDAWIIQGKPVISQGYQATLRLLQQYPQITGIFAYNDLLAVGALRACEDLGRCVPDACAVVGFDDIFLASLVSPSLTTIGVDKYGLGRLAVERLLEMLANPAAALPALYIDVELVVRESA